VIESGRGGVLLIVNDEEKWRDSIYTGINTSTLDAQSSVTQTNKQKYTHTYTHTYTHEHGVAPIPLVLPVLALFFFFPLLLLCQRRRVVDRDH
jgi:hypothetical protein